tara:strand:+ start:867 stop:1121 length:255 start_codon:yes stop_codon:yes gene_type:complete
MNTFCIGKFPIGTQYMPMRKNTYLCTVKDIHKTFNNSGDLVRTSYVATHEFCGQTITESDVTETTIARGVIHMTENMRKKEKHA